MKLKFSLQHFSNSFLVALGIHLAIFAFIGFSLPTQEIAFGEVDSDKNVITFDLASMSFGGKSGGGKIAKSSSAKTATTNIAHSPAHSETSKTTDSSASLTTTQVGTNNNAEDNMAGNGGSLGEGNGEGIGSGAGSEGRFQGAVSNYKEPQYPAIAIKRNLQGTAIIKINIKGNGEVQSFEMLQGTGHQVLDTAVLDAVKNWKFKAHPKGIGYFVKKTVVFVLR